jgi:cobalt-zinc-cadmium resistance protein CzcA
MFGIAVLNGIVLIEHFKELKEQGVKSLHRRIIMGTRQRLRPVLLTASAAALGFLPMAISTSAGAEVQRPLATVVVGGLITATALTLIVLPVLYALVEASAEKKRKQSGKKLATLALLVMLLPAAATAQQKPLSMDEAIELALQQNNQLKASKLSVEEQKALIGSAIDIDKTSFYYGFDENNIALNNAPLHVWGLSQSIKFPTVYHAQKKVQKDAVALAEQQYRLDERVVKHAVSRAYLQLSYAQQLLQYYAQLDSVYSTFAEGAKTKFEFGESNMLEQLSAQAKAQEIQLMFKQQQEQVKAAQIELNRWVQLDSVPKVITSEIEPLETLALSPEKHPLLNYYQQMQTLSQRELNLAKQELLPDIEFEVFQGTNTAANARIYSGVQAGLAVPLWFGAQRSKIRAAKVQTQLLEAQTEDQEQKLMSRYQMLLNELTQQRQALTTYQESGKQLAENMMQHADVAYRNGELDYLQYSQLLEQSITIKTTQLTNRLEHNLTVLDINYLID